MYVVVLPQTSEVIGAEKSKRNNTNQNVSCHTESNSNGVKTMCDQVPKRNAACNLRKRLEETEHGDMKLVGPKGSHSDFQFGYDNHRPPDVLPRAISPEFVPCEGERGFGLHQKKELVGDAGSGSRVHSAEYPFLGTCGNKSSPRSVPTLSESGFTHITCQGPNERLGLKVYKCIPLMGSENAAPEKSKRLGVEDAPVKDGGDCSDSVSWRSSSTLGPCSSLGGARETLDTLAGSGNLQQFLTVSCLSDKDKNSKSCRIPDSPEETTYYQSGKIRVTLVHPPHRKADFKTLSGAEPSSMHRQPSSAPIASLSSQQDSGFDSPIVNLD